MTWVAWRQHRGRAAAGAAMLLGYCLLAVAEHRFRRLGGATTSLAIYLPVMIGVFWGAPLLALGSDPGRFWVLQGIEAGTYLALVLCLLAFVFWWVPRRSG